MLSHQQNMDDFADGHKIWMISLIIMFAVRPICIRNSIFKMSSSSPDKEQFIFLWFTNIYVHLAVKDEQISNQIIA